MITELGPWDLSDHPVNFTVAVNLLERIRCPECDRYARVGWKRSAGGTEFYCIDCGFLGIYAGTFQLNPDTPNNVPWSDHVDGLAMHVQSYLTEARTNHSAVDKLARIAYDDLVAKLRPLVVRQDALEKAIEELAQKHHMTHLHHTHIDNWRDCWKQECAEMRELLKARVEIDE